MGDEKEVGWDGREGRGRSGKGRAKKDKAEDLFEDLYRKICVARRGTRGERIHE